MTTPRAPGWHPDPEHPTALERYWDGERWTDDSRPTGYVTQPAGAEPLAPGVGAPFAPGAAAPFGAAPPETGGPQAARRRLRAAEVAVAVTVVLAVLAAVVLLL